MTQTLQDPISIKLLDILHRQETKGLETYNQTLTDCPPESYDWNTMLIEELIDGLKYSIKENLRLQQEILTLRSRQNINFENIPNVETNQFFGKPPYADLDD